MASSIRLARILDIAVTQAHIEVAGEPYGAVELALQDAYPVESGWTVELYEAFPRYRRPEVLYHHGGVVLDWIWEALNGGDMTPVKGVIRR